MFPSCYVVVMVCAAYVMAWLWCDEVCLCRVYCVYVLYPYRFLCDSIGVELI